MIQKTLNKEKQGINPNRSVLDLGQIKMEVGEENSPLDIHYKEFGFSPEEEKKLLKGFVQEQGTDVYVQNSVRGSE